VEITLLIKTKPLSLAVNSILHGILKDSGRAQATSRLIANNMGLDQDAVLTINNYTHGWIFQKLSLRK
jgi:hypothetical protein